MSEDEARKKWCPFAREYESADVGAVAVNRTGMRQSKCIASACMAWRWFETSVRNDSLAEPVPNVDPGEFVRSTHTHGCCGLAGDWFGQMRDSLGRAQGDQVP